MTNLDHEHYPAILRDLGEKVADLLIDDGLGETDALAVAWEVTEHIRVEWGGRDVYVCKRQKKASKNVDPLPGQEALFGPGELMTPEPLEAVDVPEKFVSPLQNAWQALQSRVPDEQAMRLAEAIVMLIRFDLSGLSTYFPKGERYENALRDADIYNSFSSALIDRFCRKHGITRRRIYQVLEIEHRRRQKPLPFNK